MDSCGLNWLSDCPVSSSNSTFAVPPPKPGASILPEIVRSISAVVRGIGFSGNFTVFSHVGLLNASERIVTTLVSASEPVRPRFIASARALFYNKDLFQKAGLTEPPKTWAEFEADAKKLKDAGVTAYGMPLGSEEAQAETAIWFYGAGGGYGDEKTLTIDSAENVVGATEMQKIIKDGLTEANPGSTNRTPLMNVFIQGKIGMQIGLPPIVGQIKDKNPSLNYGIAPIPTKDGSAFTLGVADHLMAFKNKTDKKASIKKFLDYFYSADVYSKWVTEEGFLPTTKSGADKMASDETIKPFLDLLPSAKFYPSTNPDWSAAQGAIQSQIGQLGQGANPSELLKSIQAKASGQ